MCSVRGALRMGKSMACKMEDEACAQTLEYVFTITLHWLNGRQLNWLADIS